MKLEDTTKPGQGSKSAEPNSKPAASKAPIQKPAAYRPPHAKAAAAAQAEVKYLAEAVGAGMGGPMQAA